MSKEDPLIWITLFLIVYFLREMGNIIMTIGVEWSVYMKYSNNVMKKSTYFTITFLIGLVLLALIYLKWNTYLPSDEAIEALGEDNVNFERNMIIFEPIGEPLGNLVFYQGGFVETASYSVLAQIFAQNGYRVYLPEMPLNLAILNSDAYSEIREKYPDDGNWYMMGHSLGGTSAIIHLSKTHPDIDALVLLGSYGTESADISDLELKVLSIVANHDEILSWDQFELGKKFLPSDTTFETIIGGNHSGFGYYGIQRGDGESTIPRKEQHDQVFTIFNSWLFAN
jgi:energy-coupling factor transporter transmembrane protein EcfT